MASSLVPFTQSESVKREAEKYSQILSVEAELESKRFVTKLSVLMSAVYDECDRSHSKVFKENLKLLAAVVSKTHAVDEVWIKKERERIRKAEAPQTSVNESARRTHVEASETSRSQVREKMSTSALSSRSSASCSRVQRHYQSKMESADSEILNSSKGVSFAKDSRVKVELPDNPLGPGQYTPEYRLISSRSGAAFSTSSQRIKDFANREISPGPAYSPRYNFLSK